MSEEVTLADFGAAENDDTQERQVSRFWGEVPEGWQLVDGSEVYEVNPNPKSDEEPNTYIEMDALDTELPHPQYFGERNASEYSGKTFTTGDTLFARITPCTENGKAALVPEMDTEVGIGSTEYAVLSPKRDRLNPWLLYYLAKSYPIHNYAVSRMRGSTGRQRVPFSVFRRELDIALPPLPEQCKIATVLYTVDQAIEKTREIIEQTSRVKKATAQDLFTHGFGNNETKATHLSAIDVEIPSHWDVKTVGEISEKVTDGAHLTPDRSDSGYLLLSARNVRNGYLDLSDVDYVPEEEYERLISKCYPEPGDILMSCSGMGLGRPCVVPEGLEFALVRSAALIKLKDEYVPEFVEQAIQLGWIQRQIQAYQSRSAQPNIFQGQIASIEIPIPPRAEQERLSEILSDFNNFVDNQSDYLDNLSRLKRGLMQDLLSGKVRTTDTNIEVPSEIA